MSIFICESCERKYNEVNRKPLSLPCGHVFCEECIKSFKVNIDSNTYKGIKCPSDNIFHKMNIKKIPVCAQIFANLPKNSEMEYNDNINQKNENLVCLRHPHKKIKFFCKTHMIFPCSICVVDHTNHNLVNVNLNKKNFEDEIIALQRKIEEEKDKFVIKKTKFEENESIINEHYLNQIKLIENYYQKIVNYFIEKRNNLIAKINCLLNENNKLYKDIKSQNLSISDNFIDLTNQISIINKDIYPKGDYETFYKIKSKILSELSKLSTLISSTYHENQLLGKFSYQPHKIAVFDNKEILGCIVTEKMNSYNIKINKLNNQCNDLQINPKVRNESVLSISQFNTNVSNIFQQNLLSANNNTKEGKSIDSMEDYGKQRVNTSSNKSNSRKPQSSREIAYSSGKNQKYLSPLQPKIQKQKTNQIVINSINNTIEKGRMSSHSPSTGFASNISRNNYNNEKEIINTSNKPKILTKNYSSKNQYIKTESSVEKQRNHLYKKQLTHEQNKKNIISYGKKNDNVIYKNVELYKKKGAIDYNNFSNEILNDSN